MLYREIIAVYSEIHTKHINTLCGQNVELLNFKLVVHMVTTGLQRVKTLGEQLLKAKNGKNVENGDTVSAKHVGERCLVLGDSTVRNVGTENQI